MASVTCNFRSKCLDFNVTVNVYLPDTVTEDMPVLYLLHGMHGDASSWINGSAIGRYARARKLCVVMPSAENSFYTNMKYGCRYYDFVAKELPEYITTLLPLSRKREKNYIAGLSMGGYGAFKIALRNPDKFIAAASLSGCLDIAGTIGARWWKGVAVANWGEDYVNTVPGSEDDLMHLVNTFPKDAPKPRLYFCCGTEDGLRGENLRFEENLRDKGFEYSYHEGPGVHDWLFWDTWIAPAIDDMMSASL